MPGRTSIGAATLGLDLPLGQVDDVLKSIVVFDSQGGVGGLTLPPRDPAARMRWRTRRCRRRRWPRRSPT
jgi:hypothetical protein